LKETDVIENEIVPFLLPHLLVAGRYSARIQSRIQARPAKAGENAFQQALTDADLSVQAFLEVAMLSRFPEMRFFSEEFADSLNAKYFPSAGDLEMLVDPIDGTRAYLDGAEAYQIIVTLRQKDRMAAVLCYMPRRHECYVAIAEKPAVICSEADMEERVLGTRRVQLSSRSRRVLLFNARDVKQALEGGFEVVDIYEEYARSHVHHGFTKILSGEAAACIHPYPQVIDAGAIAFVAQQAGGVLSQFNGEPLLLDHSPHVRGPGLVVSAAADVHQEILLRLGNAAQPGIMSR
jgi:fructose-1,6-bisphosphatase/inositol monophosphatase family enzyme